MGKIEGRRLMTGGRPMARSRRRGWLLALVALALSTPSQAGKSPAWYMQKPPASTQVSRSAKDRGVNPCNSPDPGYGVYGRWDRGPSMGQMLAPEKGGLTPNGEFDVMFHFHGHEPARKE